MNNNNKVPNKNDKQAIHTLAICILAIHVDHLRISECRLYECFGALFYHFCNLELRLFIHFDNLHFIYMSTNYFCTSAICVLMIISFVDY